MTAPAHPQRLNLIVGIFMIILILFTGCIEQIQDAQKPFEITPSATASSAIKHVTVVWDEGVWEVDRIDDNVTCYVRYPDTLARSTAISCIPDTYVKEEGYYPGAFP